MKNFYLLFHFHRSPGRTHDVCPGIVNKSRGVRRVLVSMEELEEGRYIEGQNKLWQFSDTKCWHVTNWKLHYVTRLIDSSFLSKQTRNKTLQQFIVVTNLFRVQNQENISSLLESPRSHRRGRGMERSENYFWFHLSLMRNLSFHPRVTRQEKREYEENEINPL